MVARVYAKPRDGHRIDIQLRDKGEVLGVCYVVNDSARSHFEAFSITPSEHGKGYGSRMLERAKRVATSPLYLSAGASCWGGLTQRQLVAFYRRHGFELLSQDEGWGCNMVWKGGHNGHRSG